MTWRALARSNDLKGLACTSAAGLFLALAGAFNTNDLELGPRLIYWQTVMLGGGTWATLAAPRLFPDGLIEARPLASILAVTLAITLPITVFVWAVTGLAFEGRLYPAAALTGFLLPVFLISLVMTSLNILMHRQPIQTHAAPTGSAPPRFLERLPFRLRGARILAVQAEDHYLRIHTDRGSDLILMRLGDALVELEGLEGAQTHRSWWVARDAVRDVRRGDGRATLTLEGGLAVPVSRRYARALRAAGWY